MTIANEITRISEAKEAIGLAIASKGVEVPAGTKIDGMAELISSINGVSLSPRPIVPVEGGHVAVCDGNGYVGAYTLPAYPPYLYTSYAIVVNGADFSGLGLGRVTLFDPGFSTIGGRTYRTVTIGGVTWLAENLDYKFSECVLNITGTSTSEPRASYYDNDEATYGAEGKNYGLLYNWLAVKFLNDNRDVLIPGWHVPTADEWDSLAVAVGGKNVAGTKLKSTSGWVSGPGTDSFGFSVLPAGYYSGSFGGVGQYSNIWTATEASETTAYYRRFSAGASMDSNDYSKDRGYSVRLVKDA